MTSFAAGTFHYTLLKFNSPIRGCKRKTEIDRKKEKKVGRKREREKDRKREWRDEIKRRRKSVQLSIR